MRPGKHTSVVTTYSLPVTSPVCHFVKSLWVAVPAKMASDDTSRTVEEHSPKQTLSNDDELTESQTPT